MLSGYLQGARSWGGSARTRAWWDSRGWCLCDMKFTLVSQTYGRWSWAGREDPHKFSARWKGWRKENNPCAQAGCDSNMHVLLGEWDLFQTSGEVVVHKVNDDRDTEERLPPKHTVYLKLWCIYYGVYIVILYIVFGLKKKKTMEVLWFVLSASGSLRTSVCDSSVLALCPLKCRAAGDKVSGEFYCLSALLCCDDLLEFTLSG